MNVKDKRKSNLKLLIAEYDTIRALAETVGTDASYLSQITSPKGTRNVGDSLARTLERGTGKPDGWMDEFHEEEYLEHSKDRLSRLLEPAVELPGGTHGYTHVPKSSLTAGLGGSAFEVESEQIVDHMAFKTNWILGKGFEPNKLALITCAGDSMYPTIQDGDLALVDTRKAVANAEGVYAIGLNQTIQIKRVKPNLDGSVKIISDNGKYEPETYTAEQAEAFMRIIGRVVWVGRELL